MAAESASLEQHALTFVSKAIVFSMSSGWDSTFRDTSRRITVLARSSKRVSPILVFRLSVLTSITEVHYTDYSFSVSDRGGEAFLHRMATTLHTVFDTGLILPVTKQTPVEVESSLLDPIVCLSDARGPMKVPFQSLPSKIRDGIALKVASFVAVSPDLINPSIILP